MSKKLKINTKSEHVPVPSFEDLVQQAVDVDNELHKLSDSLSEVSVSTVQLPKLGPNKLQDRFHLLNQKIPVINRKCQQETWNAINEALDEQNTSRGIYIHGPSGLGKSYTLYYVVSLLRLQPELCRVTYINSCEVWWNTHKKQPYEYLLKELLCTFNMDKLPTKTIVEWANFVMEARGSDFRSTESIRGDRFIMFLDELENFVKQKDLYWIWIFDQHNALYKYNILNIFPFSLVKSLPASLNEKGLIIVSASANNEVFPKEFKSWKLLNLFGGYDDEEFNEWCKLYNYDIDGDLETKSQLEVIKFWTGAYPLELDIWHQTPGNNLSEKSQNYLANRKAIIGLSHQSYIESLSIGRNRNLSQCVTSMILQTDPPEMDYGMDRQLMHKDTILVLEGQNKDKEVKVNTIIAIHPLARLAIIHAHDIEIISGIQVVASTVLRSTAYTNDAKGRIAELYIITGMEMMKFFEFKCRKLSRNKPVQIEERIEFDNVIRFTNNDVPVHMKNFNTNQKTFFIPVSPNYPCVDCLVWNPQNKKLFAFQITVSELAKHVNSVKNFLTKGINTLRNKWATLCNINESDVYFIWIAPDDVIDEYITKNIIKDNHQLYVTFSSIKDQFPALASLNRYNEN